MFGFTQDNTLSLVEATDISQSTLTIEKEILSTRKVPRKFRFSGPSPAEILATEHPIVDVIIRAFLDYIDDPEAFALAHPIPARLPTHVQPLEVLNNPLNVERELASRGLSRVTTPAPSPALDTSPVPTSTASTPAESLTPSSTIVEQASPQKRKRKLSLTDSEHSPASAAPPPTKKREYTGSNPCPYCEPKVENRKRHRKTCREFGRLFPEEQARLRS